MNAFTIRNIDHVVLRVRDLAAALHFYCDVLGCTLERRRDDLGLFHLRAGSAMIDLVTLDGRLGRRGGAGPAAEGRNVDHVCLRIDPFDERALVHHLAASGLEPLAPAGVNFGAEGNGPSMYIRDPDGNVVELKGPAGQPLQGAPSGG
jgi:glyoxylase I family protein